MGNKVKAITILGSFLLGCFLSSVLEDRSIETSSKLSDPSIRRFSFETAPVIASPSLSHKLPDDYSQRLLNVITSTDYKKEIEEMLNAPLDLDLDVFSYLLENWGKKEGKLALIELEKILEKAPNRKLIFDERLKEDVINGWITQDPETVAHYYKENGEKYYPYNFLPNLMESWGSYRPQDALQWLKTLDDEKKQRGLNGLIRTCFTRGNSNFLEELGKEMNGIHLAGGELDARLIVSQMRDAGVGLECIPEGELKKEMQSLTDNYENVDAIYDNYKSHDILPETL